MNRSQTRVYKCLPSSSVKRTLLKTLHRSGAFAPFHWANRNKVLILTYHRFGGEEEASKISAGDFETHLKYLKAHNQVLPLAETIDYLKKGKSLPRNTTVITIDDGYTDAYDIAFPLLKKFGFPATVYVITDFLDKKSWLWTDVMRYVLMNTKKDSIEIEFAAGDTINCALSGDPARLETASRINERLKKLPNELKDEKISQIGKYLEVDIPALPPDRFGPLTWMQCQEMEADNIRIESHTVTHPILTKVGPETLDFEMRTSKKRLEDILGRRIDHFCYPNGTMDRNVQAAAKNAGYASAVTTAYGFNDAQTDLLSMDRIDAPSTVESFAQSASGFEAARLRWSSRGA